MENLTKQKVELQIQEAELDVKEFFLGLPKPTFYIVVTLLVLTIPMFFLVRFGTMQLANASFKKTQSVSKPAVFTSLPVQIIESKVLTMAGDSYAAYSLIKNQNTDLVASELKYSFEFLDAQDSVISKISESTYILGGEQKYLIVPQVTLTRQPSRVRVTVEDPLWKKRIALPNVIIQNSLPRYGDQTNPDGFFVASTLTNTSPYTISTIRVNGIIFNNQKQVIAVSQYTANTVQPRESRDYRMFWPLPLGANVGAVPQIVVETNILDLNNLR